MPPVPQHPSYTRRTLPALRRLSVLLLIMSSTQSLITSRGIAGAGIPKREYMDRKLSEDFEGIIEGRSLYSHKQGHQGVSIIDGGAFSVKYAMPIISDGDVVGCVASVYSGEDQSDNATESKLIQTAAAFLGKQFEN